MNENGGPTGDIQRRQGIFNIGKPTTIVKVRKMNLRSLSLLNALLFCFLVETSSFLLAQPNVILIVTDDQGYGDIACHGNPWLKTPNLDQMFAESVRLQNYHVDPVCTDVFFHECHRFVSKQSGKPFFAYLPLNAMHGPHTVAEEYSAPFTAQGHPENRAKFYGMITNFDENLGRLFDTLKRKDLAQGTIVIFTGDNGTAAGGDGEKGDDGFNAGRRGKKGSVYDGGYRVACFVRWPGRLKE